MRRSEQAGFTIVELLVTLLVGAVLLMSGYQLYGVVTDRAGEARRMSEASNIGYEVLRREGSVYTAVTDSCSNPERTPISRPGGTLPNTRIVLERCRPYADLDLIKVSVIVTYGTPERKVVHAINLAD